MNLILRFYEPESGAVLIDGQDIGKVGRASLRRRLAYVSQETFLFKGSIADNIAPRPGGRLARRDRGRGEGGSRSRLHHELRPGLRQPVRRAGHAAFRRPAPAHRHRPRVPQGRADHPARRSDLGARFRVRARGAGGAENLVRRAHDAGHRPPAHHCPQRRPHLRRRERRGGGIRPPRSADGEARRLLPPPPDAVRTRDAAAVPVAAG